MRPHTPLDAITVYESEAMDIIEGGMSTHYDTAVQLMKRIRRLADAAGQPDRFTSLLTRVRTEHRAKSKLKRLLNAEGW